MALALSSSPVGFADELPPVARRADFHEVVKENAPTSLLPVENCSCAILVQELRRMACGLVLDGERNSVLIVKRGVVR